MSETPKPRGRPAQGPKSGKGAVLTTRITAETRAALEAEAYRTGRSISQVAELWIEQARRDEAYWIERLGGPAMARAMLAVTTLAPVVDLWTGKDRETDPHTAILAAEVLKEQIDKVFFGMAAGELQRQGLSRAEAAKEVQSLRREVRDRLKDEAGYEEDLTDALLNAPLEYPHG